MKNSVISKFAVFSFSALCMSLLAFFISLRLPLVAEFFNLKVGGAVRAMLAVLTNRMPFSAFEVLLFASPIFVFLFLLYIFRAKLGIRDITRRFLNVCGVLSLFLSVYVFTVGIPYASPPLYEKIGAFDEYVTEDDIFSAAKHLRDGAAENYTDAVLVDTEGIRAEIIKAFGADLPYINIERKLKCVKRPEFMTELGTLALYSFFSGEINLNREAPSFLLPITAAHEYMHALGAAGEADADFSAFCALSASSDRGYRYSAYMSAIIDIIPLLSEDNAREIISSMPPEIISDIEKYNAFLSKSDRDKKNAAGRLNHAHTYFYNKENKKDYSFSAVLTVNYIKKLHLA